MEGILDMVEVDVLTTNLEQVDEDLIRNSIKTFIAREKSDADSLNNLENVLKNKILSKTDLSNIFQNIALLLDCGAYSEFPDLVSDIRDFLKTGKSSEDRVLRIFSSEVSKYILFQPLTQYPKENHELISTLCYYPIYNCRKHDVDYLFDYLRYCIRNNFYEDVHRVLKDFRLMLRRLVDGYSRIEGVSSGACMSQCLNLILMASGNRTALDFVHYQKLLKDVTTAANKIYANPGIETNFDELDEAYINLVLYEYQCAKSNREKFNSLSAQHYNDLVSEVELQDIDYDSAYSLALEIVISRNDELGQNKFSLGQYNHNLLIDLLTHGRLGAAECLVKSTVEYFKEPTSGRYALYLYCAMTDDLDTFNLVIDEFKAENQDIRYFIQAAIRKNSLKMLNNLLFENLYLTDELLYFSIMTAMYDDAWKAFKLIIENVDEFNKRNSGTLFSGYSSLQQIIFRGCGNDVELLKAYLIGWNKFKGRKFSLAATIGLSTKNFTLGSELSHKYFIYHLGEAKKLLKKGYATKGDERHRELEYAAKYVEPLMLPLKATLSEEDYDKYCKLCYTSDTIKTGLEGGLIRTLDELNQAKEALSTNSLSASRLRLI